MSLRPSVYLCIAVKQQYPDLRSLLWETSRLPQRLVSATGYIGDTTAELTSSRFFNSLACTLSVLAIVDPGESLIVR